MEPAVTPSRQPGALWILACAAMGTSVALLSVELNLASLVSFWGSQAFLIVVGMALGLLVARTWARYLLMALNVLLLGLWLFVCFGPVSARLAHGLARADALPADWHADGIFVFSSGLQADGELSAMAMTRLVRGLELLGQGDAPRLLLTEVHGPNRSYVKVARTMMANLGLKQEVVSVGRVHNTHDEAVALGMLFRQRGWKRVIAVTSPTHSRRASLALEHEQIEVVSIPCVETNFDLETLDDPRDRLHAFGSLIHERVGLWWYRFRHWIK